MEDGQDPGVGRSTQTGLAKMREDMQIEIHHRVAALVPEVCKEMTEFARSHRLSPLFFENIEGVLALLSVPETYHLNAFLFQLAFGAGNEEFCERARKVLKESLVHASFNPADFISDEVFHKLLELLQSDDPVVVKLSYELICRIFDVSEVRNGISSEIYQSLFAFVRENLDKAGIVAAICTRASLLDESILREVFPLIVVLIQGKPKELPEIGLLILVELLEDGIDVDQAFLSKCIEPFYMRLDSEISSCVMKIMMNLQEAPHSFLPRLLQIMYSDAQNEFYGETELEIQKCCGTSALCLLKKFANQDGWDDEEKKKIIYTLVSLLDSFTYRNIKGALQILIKIMDPLPTDVRFFKKLAQVIGDKDFAYVGLDAILQILQKCELGGIDPEMIEVLHDMEPELERLQLVGNSDIADLSKLVCGYM